MVYEDEYDENKLIAGGHVYEAMYVKELREEIDRLTKTINSTGPICPRCKVLMKQSKFNGYYESFCYWACDCDDDDFEAEHTYIGEFA